MYYERKLIENVTECEEIAAASKMDKGATNKEEGTLKFAGKKR